MPTPSRKRLHRLLVLALLAIGLAFSARAMMLRPLEARIAELCPPRWHPPTLTWNRPPPPDLGPASFEEMLQALGSRQGKELNTFLYRLDGYAENVMLTNEQIDPVVAELQRIEANDPYQEMRWGFKVPHDPDKGRLEYLNRPLATGAIKVLGFRKIANPLRSLPLEERVARVIEFFEERTEFNGDRSAAASWFGGELWRIGTDAVPFIVRRAEEAPEHRHRYIVSLGQRADPRAIDFLLATLRDSSAGAWNDRHDAIQALGNFHGPRVVEALIEVMDDPTRIAVDVRMTQQLRPDHVCFPAYRYPARELAASALSDSTGKHWGFVFNNDPKAWRSWWLSENKSTFDPSDVPRSEDELAALTHDLLHRFMARELAWTDREKNSILDSSGTLVDSVRDLVKLGPRVVPHLVQAHVATTTEFPVWRADLGRLTPQLLRLMDTPESRLAAAALQGP